VGGIGRRINVQVQPWAEILDSNCEITKKKQPIKTKEITAKRTGKFV
jgi:hypothetical protein